MTAASRDVGRSTVAGDRPYDGAYPRTAGWTNPWPRALPPRSRGSGCISQSVSARPFPPPPASTRTCSATSASARSRRPSDRLLSVSRHPRMAALPSAPSIRPVSRTDQASTTSPSHSSHSGGLSGTCNIMSVTFPTARHHRVRTWPRFRRIDRSEGRPLSSRSRCSSSREGDQPGMNSHQKKLEVKINEQTCSLSLRSIDFPVRQVFHQCLPL